MSINYSNFAFPKPEVKEKVKKGIASRTRLKSKKKLVSKKNINKVSDKKRLEYREDKKVYESIKNCKCDICTRNKDTQIHHLVFGTANRQLSTKYKLLINVCDSCHKKIHNLSSLETKKIGQEKFEREHSREEFIKVFGKSYL